MRLFAHALILAATVMAAATPSAFAGEAKKSKIFTEPRLGLGADIPDEVLFSNDALQSAKPRARVTVRSRKPKASSSKPILHGWAVKNIEVADDSGWQTSEAIRPGCFDSTTIMNTLIQAGWSQFARFSVRPRTIALNARRRDGRVKRVQLDRCTGEIIHVSASYTK